MLPKSTVVLLALLQASAAGTETSNGSGNSNPASNIIYPIHEESGPSRTREEAISDAKRLCLERTPPWVRQLRSQQGHDPCMLDQIFGTGEEVPKVAPALSKTAQQIIKASAIHGGAGVTTTQTTYPAVALNPVHFRTRITGATEKDDKKSVRRQDNLAWSWENWKRNLLPVPSPENSVAQTTPQPYFSYELGADAAAFTAPPASAYTAPSIENSVAPVPPHYYTGRSGGNIKKSVHYQPLPNWRNLGSQQGNAGPPPVVTNHFPTLSPDGSMPDLSFSIDQQSLLSVNGGGPNTNQEGESTTPAVYINEKWLAVYPKGNSMDQIDAWADKSLGMGSSGGTATWGSEGDNDLGPAPNPSGATWNNHISNNQGPSQQGNAMFGNTSPQQGGMSFGNNINSNSVVSPQVTPMSSINWHTQSPRTTAPAWTMHNTWSANGAQSGRGLRTPQPTYPMPERFVPATSGSMVNSQPKTWSIPNSWQTAVGNGVQSGQNQQNTGGGEGAWFRGGGTPVVSMPNKNSFINGGMSSNGNSVLSSNSETGGGGRGNRQPSWYEVVRTGPPQPQGQGQQGGSNQVESGGGGDRGGGSSGNAAPQGWPSGLAQQFATNGGQGSSGQTSNNNLAGRSWNTEGTPTWLGNPIRRKPDPEIVSNMTYEELDR